MTNVSLACCGPANCSDCPYYRRIQRLPGRLLLIGRAAALDSCLRKDEQWQILHAKDAYQAGQLVMQYFPAVAVVDSAAGKQGRQFIERLLADPHAVRTRVVFVAAGRRPKSMLAGLKPADRSRVGVTVGPLSRRVLESVLPAVPAPLPARQVR